MKRQAYALHSSRQWSMLQREISCVSSACSPADSIVNLDRHMPDLSITILNISTKNVCSLADVIFQMMRVCKILQKAPLNAVACCRGSGLMEAAYRGTLGGYKPMMAAALRVTSSLMPNVPAPHVPGVTQQTSISITSAHHLWKMMSRRCKTGDGKTTLRRLYGPLMTTTMPAHCSTTL